MKDSTTAHPLIVLGSGPMAFTVRDMLESMERPPYGLAGFAQNLDPARRGETFEDVRVFSLEELAPLAATHRALCVLGNCAARRRFVGQAAAMGFRFATLADPTARVSKYGSIGEGGYLRPDVLVMNHSHVGPHTSIMSRVTITEDNRIGGGCFIGSAVVIGGGCVIGDGVFIGLGAVLRDHVRIGDNATVGAGAVVIRDVPAGVTVAGNPAREIPTHPA